MNKTIIIAEAGVNHNGDIEQAKKLILAAAEAKADFVKFQSFKTEKLVSQTAKLADYQKENSPSEISQFKMLKRLELSLDDHKILQSYAKVNGIEFLSTGFDEDSVDLLDELDIPVFKVPSGELTNKPLLEHIGNKGKPVILSTGMANLEEINEAYELLGQFIPANKISILHCNTAYPTPLNEVNLNVLETLRSNFNAQIGYSDHTLGINIPIAAVALGATIIEKHFTLDRNLEGPDHKASLTPDELKLMVQGIREIEKAMGSKEKTPTQSELKNVIPARRSIHIAKDIPKGTILSRNDLIMLRPGDGISPMRLEEFIGKKTIRDLTVNTKLNWNDLEN